MRTPTRPDAGRNASPYLYGQETARVAQVLASGHYGHTDVTEEFEQRVAAFLGVPDTVAVASGTAALHTALLAAGVGPGKEVIVPSMTFCATVQAILAVGACPRFVDIDSATLCVNGPLVREAISEATAAVVPVLFGGRAVDLTPVMGELRERDVVVIEDAAHAFGSHTHNGAARVGATGALTCFSFGPIKNLTCGQGGMVVPRTAQEATALRQIRLLGVATSARTRAHATGYPVEAFGLRYQLSAINAAIGLAQLDHFDATVHARRRLWCAYRDALAPLEHVTLVDVDVDHSVPHLCQIRVPHRDQVFHAMRARNIGVGVHYPPNHLQPAFASWARPMPVTEQIGREVLSLPFHQHLTETDINLVVSALAQALASTGGAPCASC